MCSECGSWEGKDKEKKAKKAQMVGKKERSTLGGGNNIGEKREKGAGRRGSPHKNWGEQNPVNQLGKVTKRKRGADRGETAQYTSLGQAGTKWGGKKGGNK